MPLYPPKTSGTSLTSKIITGTRDLAAANGSVSYTGVGFTPTVLIMNGCIEGTPNLVNCTMSDSSRTAGGFECDGTSANFRVSTNLFAPATNDAGNYVIGVLSSYDADGFTVAWTKTGSPTGTFSFTVLCLK